MIRIIAIVFLTLSLLFLNSCHSDGDFMLLLRTDYYKNQQGDFTIIISDKGGNIIVSKNFKALEPIVELYGLASGTMTVTTIVKSSVNSIQGVPVGSEFMSLPSESHPSGQEIGKASYTLRNYVGNDQSQFALAFSPYGVSNTASTTYDGSTYTTELQLEKAPADLLVTGYRDDLPVYQWYRNVQPGDAISANFDTFTPMKMLKVNKPVDTGLVLGFTGEDYRSDGIYYLSDFFRQLSSKSVARDFTRLGYLEGFANYLTSARLIPNKAKDHYEEINYEKWGSLPSSITMPDYNLTVTDMTPKNFKFQSGNKYTFVTAFFTSSEPGRSVVWGVTAPNNEQILLPEIPDDIAAQYNLPSREKLKLYYFYLYDIVGGYDYNESIAISFGSKKLPGKYEFIQYLYRQY